MQEQLQDSDIIRQVLGGQQHAYSVLVERYQHFVFTIAFRHVKNREEAEDMAQEAFIKAYRSLADFKGDSKFSTWLYVITNNTCISYTRKNRMDTISLDEQHHNFIADDPKERRSQKSLIQQALDHLPDTDAQVITLFYLAEQSLEETGQILGLSLSNVKVRLFRARQKLKEILEQKFKEELKHL
jgi:RNA polymerase sigma factor (sigma-70 family)